MKKLIIAVLALGLVGCMSNNLSQEEMFKMKQECSKYQDDFISQYGDDFQTVFYSPKLNTCVLYYIEYLDIGDSKSFEGQT